MRTNWWSLYARERRDLLVEGVDALLESGRAWDLSRTLSARGAVIFPHCWLRACGNFVASAVHAVLDSGADQVLGLGVLHAGEEEHLRVRRMQGGVHPLRGVFGPDLGGLRRYWREHSLEGFEFLLRQECGRRGVSPPKLFKRYPFLVGEQPESLPGIDSLIALSRDSAVVATADFVHHGKSYGDRELFPLCEDARVMAVESVERSLMLMVEAPCEPFRLHCERARCDGLDVCRVLRYLLELSEAQLIDLRLVDVSDAFEGCPQPSWVAGALATCRRCP